MLRLLSALHFVLYAIKSSGISNPGADPKWLRTAAMLQYPSTRVQLTWLQSTNVFQCHVRLDKTTKNSALSVIFYSKLETKTKTKTKNDALGS